MLQKIMGLLLLIVFLVCGGTLPATTGLILTDSDGKTYDLDAILASGKHIMVHQTGST